MSKVIISPWSKKQRNGRPHGPKDYPWWPELIKLLKEDGHYVIQIGVPDEELLDVDEFAKGLSFRELQTLAMSADIIITVDNFFQHFCDMIGKKCYAIFGPSDPRIFGHETNVNILKDRKYLRKKQFDVWEAEELNNDAFVSPKEVMRIIRNGG